MALVHVLGVLASGFVSVAFASSLFFGLSTSASRGEVLRYVVISLIPMAALGPVLGPLLDRRVRDPRRLLEIANTARAGCCVILVLTLGTPGFYVTALALLVANKAFSVGRQAILPELVTDRSRLVGANAGLARLGAASGAAATALGVGLIAVFGVRKSLLVAAVVFLFAARQGRRIPAITTHHHLQPAAAGPARVAARAGAAAAAFALVRGAIAVWALGLAFAMRRDELALAAFGVAAGAYSLGSLAGNVTATRMARGRSEETVIATAAAAAAVAAALAALTPTAVALALSGALLGLAGSSGRLAFEAAVQATTAPGCRGRVYAKLETWVQLAWAGGAAGVVAAGLGASTISATVALLLAAATTLGVRGRFGAFVDALPRIRVGTPRLVLVRSGNAVAALLVAPRRLTAMVRPRPPAIGTIPARGLHPDACGPAPPQA
ncbi:MAG: hypothetical protein QM733_21035 [Ilumatobacteraceae bacterium]